MTSDQLLWAANTGLLSIVGLLIWDWKKSVKESFSEINKTFEKIDRRIVDVEKKKQDTTACVFTHEEVRKRLHSHARLGTAGEVIQ